MTADDVEGYESFVYVVRRLSTGKSYIGKKILRKKVTRPPLKGKTRKRRSTAPSDWETYWGSSEELLSDRAVSDPSDWEREVLILCKTRGEASYHEARLQFEHGVLLDPDRWYNSWIMVKVHRRHVMRKK